MNDEEFELIPTDPVDMNAQTEFRHECARANRDLHR
jgi:hypothetical protein